MGRWEPDARGRLLRAALELFSERGYEATTTAQIAERAGLTKATLFRLFPDKREIVFQGQARLVALVTTGVQNAPAEARPVELVAAGLSALSDAHTQEHRDLGRTLDAIVASSEELRERAVFKRWAITSAFEQALIARLGDPHKAGVLADLGTRAFYTGGEKWLATDDRHCLADYVLRELASYEDLMRACFTAQ
ncbi:TetR/AcrR family transcriptional regulator [Nocardia bovistercoris]|uniref:TetR/AcrR family transcriptional regulator n=1 Tax=Nocardia bovistercoris TaxID=2785916 RepID=A0A931IIW0_9NOCA|nr:TetR/AcrR family transcriptional regulator [Nocardia bovistercoris]MBH0780505.1 TetR/AcrR family transcriptional regulator [Nocardia bovistercoris]